MVKYDTKLDPGCEKDVMVMVETSYNINSNYSASHVQVLVDDDLVVKYPSDINSEATQQVKIRPLQPDLQTFSVNVLNTFNFIPWVINKGTIIGYCQILRSKKKSFSAV